MHGKIRLPQLPFLTREMLRFGNKTPMRLRLTAAADIVGEVALRGFTRHGMIELHANTTADGVIGVTVIGIDDFPIMLSVGDVADAYGPNQCWVNVNLEMNEEETISLCSGFVYVDKGVGWPNMNHVDAVPGRGRFAEAQSNDAAAGAELLMTVPAGELWKLNFLSVQLTTDANAADRVPHFVFTLPGGVVLHTWAAQTITASQVTQISAAVWGVISGIINQDDYRVELPHELWLPAGSTVTTVTENLQVGDNWAVLTAQVEKFFAQS